MFTVLMEDCDESCFWLFLNSKPMFALLVVLNVQVLVDFYLPVFK